MFLQRVSTREKTIPVKMQLIAEVSYLGVYTRWSSIQHICQAIVAVRIDFIVNALFVN